MLGYLLALRLLLGPLLVDVGLLRLGSLVVLRVGIVVIEVVLVVHFLNFVPCYVFLFLGE